ncbi:MAG: TonB-dependent receptor [Gammaproteobacteria bacterium]|nr:TonB-dependent receptor [Gammaproteobacteria bacterium]MBQ0839234.1 TonB-dependent receptor [Gammaproteobacteria bacterium]
MALARYLPLTLLLPLIFIGEVSLANELPINQAGADKELVIEEVVIKGSRTGQKASQWLGSVYSLTESELQLVRHRHITEALVRAPGVWISRGNGQEHLTALRSPVLTGAGACGAFVMAEDNIPLRAAGFCNVNQLLEATSELAAGIEVLPGPQSVLYGSNALHGVINILSPPLYGGRSSSRMALETGSHDYYRSQFVHRTGNSYLGFDGTRDGGYKDDAGFDQQKAKLRYGASLGKVDIISSAAFTNLNQETAGFVRGDDAYKDSDRQRENPNPEAYRDVRSQRWNTRFEVTVDAATQWTFTPYVRNTEMEFLMHFVPWQPLEKNSHYSLGWQSGLKQRLNQSLVLNLGLDGEYTRGELQETQSQSFSPAIPSGTHYDYRVAAQVVSPFAALSWQLNSATTISAGLRYEWLHYDYDNKAPGESPCAGGIDCRFIRPEDGTDSYNNASWQFGAVHKIYPRHSVFMNYARAYRAPQTTELYRLQNGQEDVDLDAETLDSIELGLRGESENWQYSIAAYLMKKDEVIFQNSQRHNISGASTLHKGLEVAASWTPTRDWYLQLNGSYARHTYDSNIAISAVNIDGNEIDTAPRYTGSAQLGHYFFGHSLVELEWLYLGSYYTDPENQHSYPGHQLVNMRVNWEVSREWKLALRVHNVADENYADRADYGFGQERYFIGEPRTAFIEISREM